MQTAGDGAVNVLAIGKANESTWGQAAFRVTVDGSVYASNIIATGGSIGGFSISGNDLSWTGADWNASPAIRFRT
jgi:hypothetical protein